MSSDDFEHHSASKRTNLAQDFIDFLKQNKKWWLLPIILVMLALGGLLSLSATGLAPFIYTLF
jgi:hypothetical protein